MGSLGPQHHQNWLAYANRQERWPRKSSPAPRVLQVPIPGPATRQTSRLSKASATLFRLLNASPTRPFGFSPWNTPFLLVSLTLIKARGRSSRMAVSLFSSRAATTATSPTNGLQDSKSSLPSATRKKSSAPPLRGRTLGDAGIGKDWARQRFQASWHCCPGWVHVALVPLVSLPT